MSEENTTSSTAVEPYEVDVTYIVPPTDYEQAKTLLSKLSLDELNKIIKLAQAIRRIETS